jgi:hypothetical protein
LGEYGIVGKVFRIVALRVGFDHIADVFSHFPGLLS